MQKTGLFTKIIFCNITFKVSAWCKIGFIINATTDFENVYFFLAGHFEGVKKG
jgi:hypothetical protein